jgi:type I restriction enzyme S subunit
MKKGWEIKRLGDVCDFEGGSQPPKSEFIYDEKPGYVRFLQIRDFGSDKNITFIRHSKKNRLCKENDILIGRYGASVGKILTNKAGAYNVALMKTIPNLEVLDRSWFYHFLVSDGFQIPLLNVADRSAQAGFSKDDIYNFPVPVPPLAEQQRIVALLDEAFEGLATAKANAEKNLQNARALFESHLQSVFTQRGEGWVETTLDKISTNLDSKRVPITKNVRSSGEYPYYGASGIVDYVADYIFEGDNLLVSEDGANLLARSTPIAFSVSGKYWVNNHAHILHFENMATQRFAEFYLESIKLDEYITGAAQPKLNQKALNSIPIPIPKSVETQSKIVESVESLQEETQRLARLYERKLAALEELKKSLLHQAFSGEL